MSNNIVKLKIRICIKSNTGYFNYINNIISKNLLYILKEKTNNSVILLINTFPHYNSTIFNELEESFHVLFECPIEINKDILFDSDQSCFSVLKKLTFSKNKLINRLASEIKSSIEKNIKSSKEIGIKYKIEYISID